MEFISAKTILSKVKNGDNWFGIDYNMNLYRGCSHGCIYCDSRSACYQNEAFDVIKGKENAIEILEKELKTKKTKGVIGIGAMSDTYNPLEKKYEITKNALKLIKKYNYGVSITTKSNLILRDIDLLKEIENIIVTVTITTVDDALAKKIEPNAPTSTERFKTIKKLNENNIYSGILLMPVLPFITDTEENIKSIIKKAHENGAKFIYAYMGMTLRDKQRDYYYEKLDKIYPKLINKYKNTYSFKYSCNSPNYIKLYKIFKEECEKYKIIYKMEDIINAYKKNKFNQLTLF